MWMSVGAVLPANSIDAVVVLFPLLSLRSIPWRGFQWSVWGRVRFTRSLDQSCGIFAFPHNRGQSSIKSKLKIVSN